MLAIIDYGAGNLLSVQNALDYIGVESKIVSSEDELKCADAAILPGVGSFEHAMKSMQKSNFIDPVKDFIHSGKPFLGICLGLQLLFEESEESPGVEGLGVFKGKVLSIPPKPSLKIPHIGWNDIEIKKDSKLFKGIPQNSYVYFVHSYYLQAEDEEIVSATTQYGVKIHAAIEKGNVMATQFHPEKSGNTGLAMLRNFTSLIGGNNNAR